MLRYREYAEYTTTRQSRFWTAFANALGFVVLPPIRLLCRVFPPLRRAVNNTPGGRMGAAFRAREGGDHRGAFLTAMEGLGKCRFATDMDPGEFMADLNWWMFMDLASTEAEHLGDADRVQVAQVLDAAPAPGGMFAAKSLCRVSVWRWKAGDRDGAIKLARLAVLADASWVHTHVLLGWFGLVSGSFDPLPHLREALRVDPSCGESIRTNADLAAAPGLLKSLGLADGPPS
ncbi:hypothetical protein AnaeK_3329 [Anaeromyxobacter sp. K]|uniref:hypothetical protein n=1 Tax=Anaeromyxobacter sp. (strain K) TaxID=447217 RepID=UPI00015F9E14|nr:hypothetical protein [Anaeromyxobacter sp. K]ACG74545.1 hypothetical protein AnaeK_3329 [Anaeromyxobacter sp. K]